MMKSLQMTAWLLAILLPATGQAEQLLYLASIKDKTIVTYAVADDSGRLTQRFRVELPGNPGPLAFSPDRSFVYAAVTNLPDGRAGVVTLKHMEDGSLALAGTAAISSRTPYIRVDKQGLYLLAAHYGDGELTVYRIEDGICTNRLLSKHQTQRTAHCVELDPSGRFVFVPHTAPNKVFQFRLDASNGNLIPNDPPFVTGPDADHKYHAPRHYAHHPKLEMAYTSNEYGGGISAWQFDPDKGTLRLRQTLSTLPAGYQGESAAADIRITPDGRFAYVSNRDVTRREEGEPTQDTLAAVALDAETGEMKVVGHFPTAHFPRSICIDLTGRFLYAAGQRSETLVAYRIDPQSGQLEHLATYPTGPQPIWVMCGPGRK